MSFAYDMGLRGPICNGCKFAQLKYELGDRMYVRHEDGWIAVYELDRPPVPGQGWRFIEHGGRPARHRVTFMSVGHSDECYHWMPPMDRSESATWDKLLARLAEQANQ